MTNSTPRRVGAAVAALCLIAGTISLDAATKKSDRPSDGHGERPNIVVIQTDDQTLASLNPKTMPATTSLLVEDGVVFANYVVSSPLCCPSRASLLTGQYAHNHGVTANVPGYAELRDQENTLPVWLGQAGYRTAHVGKYLNNWDREQDDPTQPLAGWDRWATMLPPYSYFDYELAVDGKRVAYGSRNRDYLTTVLNRRAAQTVKDFSGGSDPFFLALDQFAPHGQTREKQGSCGLTALPLPGDFRRFARSLLPRPPSFNESDVSDKPAFRQRLGELSEERIRSIRDNYRCRLASLRAVDRGVERLVQVLRESGELDNTAISFTSDNGFLQGEHRIPGQKAQSFEEAVRVPLVVWLGRDVLEGNRASGRIEQVSSNIDLAPTILELAGARPCRDDGRCRTMDGRSFVGALAGRAKGAAEDRAILLTFASGHRRNNAGEGCAFAGLRTSRFSYTEYSALPDPATDECRPAAENELYDLRDDPAQLENLERREGLAVTREETEELRRRLALLRDCAGVQGRDEQTGDRPFCE
jgi:N-acetylglucosamine-6-sulfatase